MEGFLILGSAALGSVATLIIKELFSFLRKEREHTLSLRGKYFDKKIDTTLTVYNLQQFTLSSLQAMIRTLELDISAEGKVAALHKFNELQQLVTKDLKNMNASQNFFYDDDMRIAIKDLNESWMLSMQAVDRFFRCLNRDAESAANAMAAVKAALDQSEQKLLTALNIAKKDFQKYKI